MGSGFKTFSAGVLTASDVNGYLMDQAVMSFSSLSAADSALAGEWAEGMLIYVRDDNEFWYYDGASRIPWVTQWEAFTPSWNNLTVGNATEAWYKCYREGDLLIRGQTTLGSTSSVDGIVSMTLPDSRTCDAGGGGGIAVFNDVGTQLYAAGFDAYPSATSAVFTHATGIMGPSSPFTWTTGDVIAVRMSRFGINNLGATAVS